MDDAQEALFGQAPRRVGTPEQHWAFTPRQVEVFIESVNGRRNAYGTLGWFDSSEGTVVQSVLYDFDSTAKSELTGETWHIWDEDPADDEVISMMRRHPDVAHDVLGDVVDEVRELALRSREDNIPVLGVFSGFGVHVHQLFEPTADPKTAMLTTANRYIDKLNLDTPDPAVLGQPGRLCRLPNCERMAGTTTGDGVTDGRSTGLYTVPLSGSEMESLTVDWLLDVSASPRDVTVPAPSERPEMPVWDEYRTGSEGAAETPPPRPLHPEETDVADDDDLRWFLENTLKMPCMVERLIDHPNPPHKVRVNCTVLLLNAGFDPETVVAIFREVNWVDYDEEITRKMVHSIARNPVNEMNCSTLRSNRLCVRTEDPESCSCYGWSGGEPEW